MFVKPKLSVEEQVALLSRRGLAIDRTDRCLEFLSTNNYYRLSGYARYFQKAPHLGDNEFEEGVTFEDIRNVYDNDAALRSSLLKSLALAEGLIRTHFARVVADVYGPYRSFLEEDFYIDVGNADPTAEACLRDIRRSRDRHILRYKATKGSSPDFSQLPVWSAVEAWSFGTLSKAIERGAAGTLSDQIATSFGVAKAGFAYRVRALVYLRNRCAHLGRLWHHSVIDAGPTPNNVRVKAKRLAGTFESRSVFDVVASLDDILVRGRAGEPLLPQLVLEYSQEARYREGLARPKNSRDHKN